MTPERFQKISYVVIEFMELIPENQFHKKINEELKKKGVTKEEYLEWRSIRFPRCSNCGFSCSSTFNYCGQCGNRLPLPETLKELVIKEEELEGKPHLDHFLQKIDGLSFCVDCGREL